MICSRNEIRRTYFTMEDCKINLKELVPNVAEVTRLVDLINLRYANNWILCTDALVIPWVDAPDSEPIPAAVEQWKNRFKYIYETTSERYFQLIKIYKESENKLLAKLNSESITKFNDTPQNVNVGDTDEYTSTISKVSNSVDPGELIDRLNNIHNKLKDLYDEWVNEFTDLFAESLI